MAPAAQSGTTSAAPDVAPDSWPASVTQAAKMLVPPPELTDDMRAQISSLFNEFDGDHNGSLDAGELQVCLLCA